MTDFSQWTDEQANEAIFRAQGWVERKRPGDYPWSRGAEHRHGVCDYCSDWRLAGMLLEEMGDAIKDGWEFSCEHSDLDGLEPLKWRVWMTRFTDSPYDFRSVHAESDNHKRAITEVWLAWKDEE